MKTQPEEKKRSIETVNLAAIKDLLECYFDVVVPEVLVFRVEI